MREGSIRSTLKRSSSIWCRKLPSGNPRSWVRPSHVICMISGSADSGCEAAVPAANTQIDDSDASASTATALLTM